MPNPENEYLAPNAFKNEENAEIQFEADNRKGFETKVL